MDVSVRDPAGREVDAVAAQQPLAGARILHDLPDEGRPVHPRGAEPRRVPLQVVDDARPGLRLHALGPLVKREDQWKYWPPSMTIVCPVTKSADGVQRKTTAPTTSSGTWSRWIVRAATERSCSFSITSG